MVERVNGSIPGSMIRCSRNKETEAYFDLNERKFEKDGTYIKWPEGVDDPEAIDYVSKMKTIEDIVPENEPELRDLLHKL